MQIPKLTDYVRVAPGIYAADYPNSRNWKFVFSIELTPFSLVFKLQIGRYKGAWEIRNQRRFTAHWKRVLDGPALNLTHDEYDEFMKIIQEL